MANTTTRKGDHKWHYRGVTDVFVQQANHYQYQVAKMACKVVIQEA